MQAFIVRPMDDVADDYDVSYMVINAETSKEAKSFFMDSERCESINDLIATPQLSWSAGIVAVQGEQFLVETEDEDR